MVASDSADLRGGLERALPKFSGTVGDRGMVAEGTAEDMESDGLSARLKGVPISARLLSVKECGVPAIEEPSSLVRGDSCVMAGIVGRTSSKSMSLTCNVSDSS